MPSQSSAKLLRQRASEREKMIREQVERRGVHDLRVLAALRSVPREIFLPEEASAVAYLDAAQPIACCQTISQPYIVAYMTELLELRPADRVLEIGTGSGYQTAVLSHLVDEVHTIERHAHLSEIAQSRLARLDRHNVVYRVGDGSLGWPEDAPFNAILATAGAPDVPQPLLDQLAVGGRLVMPVGPTHDQYLVRVRRVNDMEYSREQILACRFVKLVGQAGWAD